MGNELRIGFDVGGTAIKSALIDPAGQVLARDRRPTGAASGPDSVIAAIEAAHATLDDPAVERLGVGFAGQLDPSAGRIRQSVNLVGWQDYPLRDELARRLGKPVTLCNDSTAYAYGEALLGAGRGARSVVCLTLGTGVGGGIVLDGVPWLGAQGGAGEYGHTCVDPNGRACGCGGRGCLETVCSASALGDVKALADEARGGGSKAVETFETAGAALGMVLGQIANTLSPEIVVIGGGMSGAWDLLEPSALRAMEAHSFAHNRAGMRVVKGLLGDDAGPIGAALMP